MCVAAALPILAMSMGAMGGLMTAYGQYQQGKATQQVAEYNAKVGEQKAAAVEDLGNIQEQQQRTKVRQIMASQRAGMASSGAVVDSGSFGDVLDSTAYMGEVDAQTIRANAAKEAWGYRVGADMTRVEGKMALNAAKYNAMGTLMTTAGKTFGSVSNYMGSK